MMYFLIMSMTIYDVGLCVEQVEWNPIPNQVWKYSFEKHQNSRLSNLKD
jgi:hypothetical protein